MLKIGEFSKLSHLTIKALRFYEKEDILKPKEIDKLTGYRLYETSQLQLAAKIKAYRQLDLSIYEIKLILSGEDARTIFERKVIDLQGKRNQIDIRLSIINNILEEKEMKYQVIVKEIPSSIVYYSEVTLPKYSDMMQYIPMIGKECMDLNPELSCAIPPYEFCEYLDNEYKESNVRIRHNEAVTTMGIENDHIKFKHIPATKALCIYHKGSYEQIGEAYAFIMKYAKDNKYVITGLARECYIDGIWNKENIEDWLTEIQLPVE